MKFVHSKLVILSFVAATANATSGQEKVFLQCDGVTKVGAYADGSSITVAEQRAFSVIKPKSLSVIIEDSKISVDGYEYSNILQKFPKENYGKSERGSLEVNATSYDGYYFQEWDREAKNDAKNGYYFYQQSRIQLNRTNGEFIWWITYYGNSSWVNDLMPVKAKDKYVTLEVKGRCKKSDVKILF